ncbi:PTS HPr component family protein [Kineothrix alysoides]|uniref:PTS HPr component family protein n=1 Tax=Kineothrix alysoides TaxID=1469948 RepID=A0A4R1R4T1_9FIRM|nr:HPr family phosphocarrier protein [Kineothrix alysoides]TCL60438.1 PTS HPr component family protein [Kineothrix alysoides]
MIHRKIRLRPDEVKKFVAAASKCDFDIDIAYNRYVVDAKSIVGVLGLDFNQILTVSYSGYDDDFESFMRHFAVAS